MRSLSVLHLAANRWWTGSADPTIQLLKGLAARGHRVSLGIIRGDRFEARAREAGLTVVPGLSLDARFNPRAAAGDMVRLRRLCAEEGIEVVHCHHSHDHWLAALGLGATARFRTFHTLRALRHGWAGSLLRRRTDGVFAVSREIKRRALTSGYAPDRVWLLPGSVDVHRFTAALSGERVRAELGLGTAPVVGSVARLAPNRGHELLIEGFRLLLRDLPEARLLLVGKGEMRLGLERRVREAGLEAQVVFAGYRDHDLPHVLAAMDCFAIMGAGSDESCRAALEAMAAGRPVVARRVGALPDTVLDGETGLLLGDDRAESVAEALGAVLKNPERARAMGAAGRRRAELDFRPERAVEVTEAAYLTVLAGRERQRRW